jgi:hypothetical protein
LKSKPLENLHRHLGVTVVSLLKGFIKDHSRVGWHILFDAAKLIFQSRSETGGSELLALTSGLAGTAPIDFDLSAVSVELPRDEFDVLSNIEHRLAPPLIVVGLAGHSLHQLTQDPEMIFRDLAIVGPGLAKSLVNFPLEILNLRQRTVTDIDA